MRLFMPVSSNESIAYPPAPPPPPSSPPAITPATAAASTHCSLHWMHQIVYLFGFVPVNALAMTRHYLDHCTAAATLTTMDSSQVFAMRL